MRADDFRRRLEAMRHRSRCAEVRDPAAFELAQCRGVVDVLPLMQAFVNCNGAGRIGADRRWIAEQPARRIDVVDAHVEKDAAARRREANEEAARIVLVERVRAHHERRADRAVDDALVRVAVARVKPAHESDHRFHVGKSLRFVFNAKALVEIE